MDLFRNNKDNNQNNSPGSRWTVWTVSNSDLIPKILNPKLNSFEVRNEIAEYIVDPTEGLDEDGQSIIRNAVWFQLAKVIDVDAPVDLVDQNRRLTCQSVTVQLNSFLDYKISGALGSYKLTLYDTNLISFLVPGLLSHTNSWLGIYGGVTNFRTKEIKVNDPSFSISTGIVHVIPKPSDDKPLECPFYCQNLSKSIYNSKSYFHKETRNGPNGIIWKTSPRKPFGTLIDLKQFGRVTSEPLFLRGIPSDDQGQSRPIKSTASANAPKPTRESDQMPPPCSRTRALPIKSTASANASKRIASHPDPIPSSSSTKSATPILALFKRRKIEVQTNRTGDGPPPSSSDQSLSIPGPVTLTSNQYVYNTLSELKNQLDTSKNTRGITTLLKRNLYGIVTSLSIPASPSSYFIKIEDESMANVPLRIHTAAFCPKIGPEISVRDIIRIHRATIQLEIIDDVRKMVISTSPHLNYTLFNYVPNNPAAEIKQKHVANSITFAESDRKRIIELREFLDRRSVPKK